LWDSDCPRRGISIPVTSPITNIAKPSDGEWVRAESYRLLYRYLYGVQTKRGNNTAKCTDNGRRKDFFYMGAW